MLLQLGEAPDAVRAEHGCYPEWFLRAWGGDLTVVDGREGARPPDPRGFAGIVISGSARSLVEVEPWVEPAIELVQRARDVGTPVLGICFGHQLLGHVFGGRVVENPNGWEIGTLEVELTDEGAADPLFQGLPPRLSVNLTHRDMIAPGAGVRVLATNATTELQAIAVDDHLRGIQFHPEFSGAVCRAYIAARRHLLPEHDVDAMLDAARDTPHGVAVMQNFRRHFVERA